MKPPLSSHTLFLVKFFLGVLLLSREASSQLNLYHWTENVFKVTARSLPHVLADPDRGKLLQFMNTFSQECYDFAPTYKSLARDIYLWRRHIRVLVIDCGEDINVQICRDYSIHETPTLRYFPPGFRRSYQNLGVEIGSKQPSAIIRRQLVTLFSRPHQSTRVAAILEPLSDRDTMETVISTRQLYDGRPFKYLVLVYQPEGSQIGVETILELSSILFLYVRILEYRRVFANFGLNATNQGLAIVDGAGTGLWLKCDNRTGQDYANEVRKYLKYFNQEQHQQTPRPITMPSIPIAPSRWSDVNVNEEILKKVHSESPRVYRSDILRGIDTLLYTVLPFRTTYDDEYETAVIEFFNVLSSINPLNKDAQTMISRLLYEMQSATNITGKLIQDTVSAKDFAKVFKVTNYIGCASKYISHRYPCSLWTLFHYWTVENARSRAFPPGTILRVVRQFAKYLFTCTGCRWTQLDSSFEDLIVRLGIDSVVTHDEEILLLWSVHNEINRQLANKYKDDMYPKIQFPSPDVCPTCWDKNKKFQKLKVLKYLKHFYKRDNLSFYGLPTYEGYT